MKASSIYSSKESNGFVELFKSAFQEVFKGNYELKQKDFVQWQRWRKFYPHVTGSEFVSVAKWAWDNGMYCPSYALTIAGLCANWSTLLAKRELNRPKKQPITSEKKEYRF